MTAPVAYTAKTAAEATGVSVDVIKRAIRAGDIKTSRPRVAGREIAKDLIPAAELERWATEGASR